MGTLAEDIAALKSDDALAECRALVEKFGGKARPPISLEQQASLVEYILKACHLADDGKTADLTIVVRLDASILADLSLTALRLRLMSPFEDDIRGLVTRR